MYGEESGYVCYGTALQNAADIGASWKAAIKDPSLLRSLPVYKQKAVDDQGRTRFHGAFTGGFSAGYHNTVGSAAGFTPAEFSSSRSNRASSQQQTVLNFLDEDELAEHQKAAVQTKDLYDTYGARPRDAAVSKAEAELANRPGLVSGLLDELLPAADSAGVRLLQKMGWRPGRGVGIQASSQVAGAKWGSVSGVSVENTPLYVLEPKSGVHGLGYDPFAGAEEFREARARKRQRQDGAGSGFGAKSLQTVPVSGKRSRGVAFGSGLQHDDDAGVMEDYVEEGGPARLGYSFELISESDDEDRFDPKRSAYPMLQQHSAPQKMLQHRNMAAGVSFVAGFVMEKGLLETQLPEPPPAPPDFDPHHKFPPKPTSAAAAQHPPPAPWSQRRLAAQEPRDSSAVYHDATPTKRRKMCSCTSADSTGTHYSLSNASCDSMQQQFTLTVDFPQAVYSGTPGCEVRSYRHVTPPTHISHTDSQPAGVYAPGAPASRYVWHNTAHASVLRTTSDMNALHRTGSSHVTTTSAHHQRRPAVYSPHHEILQVSNSTPEHLSYADPSLGGYAPAILDARYTWHSTQVPGRSSVARHTSIHCSSYSNQLPRTHQPLRAAVYSPPPEQLEVSDTTPEHITYKDPALGMYAPAIPSSRYVWHNGSIMSSVYGSSNVQRSCSTQPALAVQQHRQAVHSPLPPHFEAANATWVASSEVKLEPSRGSVPYSVNDLQTTVLHFLVRVLEKLDFLGGRRDQTVLECVVRLTLSMWQRASGALDTRRLLSSGCMQPWTCALISCLWIAMKLEAPRKEIVQSSKIASLTSLSVSQVSALELHTLRLLDWRPYGSL